MLAAWYERNGPASEVLTVGDMSDPEPQRGEVLVRLRAAGVNPSDAKGRSGNRAMVAPRVIPSSDGAGIIEAVGAGVTRKRIGDRVWIYNGQHQRAFGTSAQRIALAARLAVPLPANITFAQGACLGVPAMTAHRCLFADGLLHGLTVLVTGGAGVVGHYAVQMALWAGARVIATVSSDDKAAHAKKAGAHAIINYRQENVEARLRELTGGKGIDRVVDVELGVNLPSYAALLRPGASIATYASSATQEVRLPLRLRQLNLTLHMVYVYTMDDAARRRALADIGHWLTEGKPKFAIAARFPLERIVEAHELVEGADKIGHVILDIR
jgi:NADPH:quinone reductase